jgi:hypothetical protein
MAIEKSEQFMVRVTPDLAEKLRRVAGQEERTVAQTIRLAIRRYLESDQLAAR